jgi:threonine dehydratase
VEQVRQGNGDNTAAHFAEGEFNDACDSTAVREVGRLTLPFLADPMYVQDFRLVSEAEVGRAMLQLTAELKKPVEPAGALAYAAAQRHAAEHAARNDEAPTIYIATVCGANVTADTTDYFHAKASAIIA